MSPFSATYKELAQDFHNRGIPLHSPGFCDHPLFLSVERNNPHYLNHYAAFVAKQEYDASYLARAKVVIDEAASLLHKELLKNGRLGACVDISAILFRILEEKQIWSCCIKGSLTISFPRKTGINTKYFWSADHGNFVAGHAWLFAPPYTVVDISVRQQPYEHKEKAFIPQLILVAENKPTAVVVEDIVSPSMRLELLSRGVPPHLHLEAAAQFIPHIFCSIPAIDVAGLQGARLKYSPVAIHAPQEKLYNMTNMTFQGLTPWQLYQSKFAGKLDDKA